MGKVIRWEFCDKLNFQHTNKGYMHQMERVLQMKHKKFYGTLKY